jgi:RNA polymerase sigma-70 factor, ECF subfamily
LAGCKKGNQFDQKMLFTQYYGLAMQVCMRYGGSKEDGEEMLNDGFIKVFNKLDLYDNNQSFEAWFRTVILRTCIDFYRKNSSKVVIEDIESQFFIESNDHTIDQIAADDILELVQKLPPSYRMVFSLYAIEGYSHAEIAELLHIQEGTSRSNLVKARIKLQEWIYKLNTETLNQNDHEFI